MGSHSDAAFFRGIEGEELAILAQNIRVSFTACVYPCLSPSGTCQMSSGTPEVRLKNQDNIQHIFLFKSL